MGIFKGHPKKIREKVLIQLKGVHKFTYIMTQARKTVVTQGEVGVYHCISRCVRRAYLCGQDSYTGRSYEHRRGWVRDRIRLLSGEFAMDVFAYAVMGNHSHVVLRNRPDLSAAWSDREVAERWCRLFRGNAARQAGEAYEEEKVQRILKDPPQLEKCRNRLADVSWFMRCLNEWLARRANREDECTGRFWEGRFKCQALVDEGAILACMAYVDLNPVRAEMVETLEESEFTSVYDRLVAKRAEARLESLGGVEDATEAQRRRIDTEKKRFAQAAWLLNFAGPENPFVDVDTEYYLSLVEWTGRCIREDKPGYIPMEVGRVLDRFGLDSEKWAENVRSYGGLFYRIAGCAERLREEARKRGPKWFRGRRGGERLYRSGKQAA